AGHMCCGVLGPDLIARVGAEAYADALALPHAREMDFTGRAMKGFVVVAAEGIASEGDLETWVERCLLFVNSLEPK
ncbi:MAG: RNA methyltransferase, partial [Gammaproteobacteria bacterium]